MQNALVWAVAVAAIAGVLLRPRNWPEAVWACGGAALMVAARLVSPAAAGSAIAKGADVYLFLTGMMLLAELAGREGVFDWLAGLAIGASGGSRARLFTLIYCVGIVVTVFLSNDATAVVLTPAVYAAVRRARGEALGYLLICAFIANAASFVLPISNPANLVVYGKTLPPLGAWLRTFLLPSIVSIAVTYGALRWAVRERLRGSIEAAGGAGTLSAIGRRAAWGIVASGVVLIATSALGFPLGVPTCAAAAVTVLATTQLRGRAIREVAGGVSWSVLPLVAGLFVLVEALNQAGAMQQITHALAACAAMPQLGGALAASFGIAALSNVMNNLPSGLLAGSAVNAMRLTGPVRDAVLIGVDLGPNLSVTGSLATILWLIVLRKEGVRIGAWEFLRIGALVMTPALLLAVAALVVFRAST